MRRAIPFAELALMTVLAVLALTLSVSRNERFSTFAAPPAGNPAVVKVFRTVLTRTLDAPSFTFDHSIDYQAPDRTRMAFMVASGVDAYVVIGDTEYVGIREANGETWGATPLTKTSDALVGPAAAKADLEGLFTSDAVTQSGDHFTVTSVLPASTFYSEDPGQVELIQTVFVEDDYVTSIADRLVGWVSVPVAQRSGGYTLGRVDQRNLGSVDYGDYGEVRTIAAPPASRVVELVTCSNSPGQTPVLGLGLHDLCRRD